MSGRATETLDEKLVSQHSDAAAKEATSELSYFKK